MRKKLRSYLSDDDIVICMYIGREENPVKADGDLEKICDAPRGYETTTSNITTC